MENESVGRLEEGNFEQVKDVQEVEVSRVIPKFIKAFAIKPYLPYLRKLEPHYNSTNSNIDYRA